MCQLRYSEITGKFTIQLRKEKYWEAAGKYLMINDIDFKYQKDYLIKMLENLNLKKEGKLPLSYRFKRRGTKLYLQVIITIENKEDSYLTNSFYGTVGLDYNDGFIELSETDRCGNLVGMYNLLLMRIKKKA